MRAQSPFRASDLAELDARLYSRAQAVVAMEDVLDTGRAVDRTIGLRHDVDNVIGVAACMAEWEAERGYRSTYFILHTAPYWQNKPLLERSLERIAGAGHEIGFHVNALAEACRTGRDPLELLEEGLDELRSYGHRVRGVVAHGDGACYALGGGLRFVNDELFTESPRPEVGAPDRVIAGTTIRLAPVSRARYGLEYDPNWLPRADYLSDSGGRWSQPFDVVAERFAHAGGRLHMLVHADWWTQAFPNAGRL